MTSRGVVEVDGMRVTVFGGTGFVGRRLCAELADAGADVLCVSRNPAPRDAAGESRGHRSLALDLSTGPVGEVAALLAAERPAVVVNATGGIWGLTDRQMDAGCAEPTRRLVAALAQASWRPRYVHLGSVLEYGPIPRGGRTHPDLPALPDTAYGRAKLAATREVLAASRSGAIDAVVLRIANVAGPGTPAISLLGRVAGQLAAVRAGGDPVVELAPLRAHRDYVDVRDVVAAVVASFRAPVAGRTVDIGRGEAVSVRALVLRLIEASEVPARLVETASAAGVAEDWLRVDPEPARKLLGWRAQRSLAESVRALWAEYRSVHVG
ncbi:NAD-dependent epimerase/dehydratase family protein [Kitasatospora sp. NPDC048239]|uniref:NAD-dependent epimerase/dehydratase family protein n=1 Tax=Kitasatospora sp. NPDC048239 TaxID=3364046 RepID=UPI003710F378